MLKTTLIEKLPFRPYLLCSKPVKPGHYSVLPSHILCVLLANYSNRGITIVKYMIVSLDIFRPSIQVAVATNI